MKNKKIISATVIALLAPTLLNCQVALAEATNTQEAVATPEVTAVSETDETTASSKEEVVVPETSESEATTESSVPTAPSETQDSETATSDSTPQANEAGKDAAATKDITVLDPEVGDVVINVLPTLSVPKGSSFNAMDGVSAYDNVNKKDVTGDVKYTIQYQNGPTSFITVPTVDTNTEGSYWITYKVSTDKGTAEVTRWVMVVAENVGMYSVSVPNLTLPKNADLAAAIESNAVVKDAYGKIIPSADAELFIGGQYSTSEVGTFTVEVGILSSEYNTVTTTSTTVTIVDPVKINAADKEIFVGDSFDAANYATATGLDGSGNTVTLPAQLVSGNVDTTTPGTYTLEYKAEDSFGNTATKTVTITVSEKPVAKASVTAEDKVMYVGDKLTTDMVMDWATFENIEGYEYGFEVVGEGIQITEFGSKLVEPGTHKIRYYATNGKDTVETFITLTVLASRGGDGTGTDNNEDNNAAGTVTPTDNNNNTKKEPVKEIKKKTEKQLPETGAQESSMMLTSIGLTLIASVYFMKKRKENEFDLY
ncbi:immunoglobulin-like domain-containing protein [Enterococcus sp. LJL99]